MERGNGYSELKAGVAFSEGFVSETEKFSDLTKMLEPPCGIIFPLEPPSQKKATVE